MDLEKDRQPCPPGESPFRMERGVLTDCLYDLEAVTIPEGVTELGTAAFLNNLYLEEVVLPGSLRRIGSAAFSGCMYLTNVSIPEGLEEIGDDAFLFSGLKEVSLPRSLKKLGDSAFLDTCLTLVRIPGTVGGIPADAFRGNSFLETVWLEEGITHIGKGAFRDCPSLREVNCPGTLLSVDREAFANSPVMTLGAPPGWLLGRQDLADKILWKCK